MKKPLDSNYHGGIDLHIHSTASDGTCTPLEIVAMAAQKGLQAISITDHDTLEGIRSALKEPLPNALQFITGVEISAAPPEDCAISGSVHILGYGVNPNHPPLQQALRELQQARSRRNPQIVEKLNQLGIAITMQEVMDHANQGSAGRPHIALAMIRAGIVKDVNEAFDRFLSRGKPAYVDKYRIAMQDAINLIHAAGGVSVLAHPYLIPNHQNQSLAALIECLKAMGLMGIEAYYPEHTPEAVTQYLELADRFDLLVTGGTDFHGDLLPDITMGSGYGDLYIPYSIFESLAQKIQNQRTR